MEEIKCKQVATLSGGKWDKVFESNKRVYSIEYIAPTLITCQGVKIIEYPLAYDEQNGYLRAAGTVGTITTDGSSQKNNNRIVEPVVYDGFNQKVRKDSSTVGTITCNVGNDLKRNGQGIVEPTKQFCRSHVFNKGGVSESEVFPTVRRSSSECANNGIIESSVRVRKLTPKECWRLMGFDDESFYRAMYGREIPLDLMYRVEKRDLKKHEWKVLWKHIRRQMTSNSQLYKQAGNSIVVDVLMAIFKNLF